MIIKCPGPYIDTGTNMPKKNKFQILSSLLPHRLGGTWWIVFHEALYHHYKINSNLELSSLFPCIFEKNLNAQIWYPHSVLPKLLNSWPLRQSFRPYGGTNMSTWWKRIKSYKTFFILIHIWGKLNAVKISIKPSA